MVCLCTHTVAGDGTCSGEGQPRVRDMQLVCSASQDDSSARLEQIVFAFPHFSYLYAPSLRSTFNTQLATDKVSYLLLGTSTRPLVIGTTTTNLCLRYLPELHLKMHGLFVVNCHVLTIHTENSSDGFPKFPQSAVDPERNFRPESC